MRGARLLGVAVFAAGLAGMLAVAWQAPGRYWTNEDLDIYLRYAQALRHGLSLYGPVPGTVMPFSYSPFAAVTLVPLTVLPAALVPVAAAGISLGALLGTVWLLLASVPDGRRRLALTAAVSGLALWTEPVQADLLLGQINLVLVLLIVADLSRAPGSRYRGAGVGIAAGIKLTPGLFAGYLLVTRQYRACLTAVVAFTATVGVGGLVGPSDSFRYWTGGFADASRIWRIASPSFVSNQSLLGLAIRSLRRDGGAAVTLLWLGLAVPIAALALLAAWRAEQTGERLLALSCVGVGTLLLSPISWSHHWVWGVIALVAAAEAALRSGPRLMATGLLAGAALVLAAWPGTKNGAGQPTGLIWHQPWSSSPHGGRPEFSWNAPEFLAGNAYVWLGVAFLATVALAVRATGNTAPENHCETCRAGPGRRLTYGSHRNADTSRQPSPESS